MNIRAGEFAATGGANRAGGDGQSQPLHVRVDVDEADIPRLVLGRNAFASRRGMPGERISLRFVRAEPILVSKRSLGGNADERVDTRVLQLIYAAEGAGGDLRPASLSMY